MEIQANWAQIKRAIDEAPWGQTGDVVQMYANRFGCSTDTIRRNIRKKFGKSRQVEREKKIDPDNRLCQIVFDLKLSGERMHLKEREVNTKWCIREMIRMDIDGVEQLISKDEYGNWKTDPQDGGIMVKTSTVNRRLNEMGYRERQPNMRIESKYANQVHMIDFSRSKYFQLFERDERKDDYMLVVSGKELHYKKDDTRLRTWIVQYMDDYSRLRKVRAYPETNESAYLGLDHLNWCWSPNNNDEHPLVYVPKEMLRSDNGAWRKSRETRNAMDAMDITLTKQMPGRKGGTAKVENRFKSLWQQFELPLAIRLGEGGRIWLSTYNELLHEFCVKEQERRHPVHRNYTKGDWYRKGLADRSVTQRTADVDLLRLACKVEKRKVDDHLRVSLNNEYYSVPQYVQGIPTTGKEVYIHENKYGELTGKLIDDLATNTFELEPWEASQWGEFASFKHTPKRLREDQFEDEAPDYNEIMQGDGRRETADGPTPNPSQEGNTSVRYLGPETEDVAPDSPFNDRIEATGKVFRTALDAREYIGIHLETYGLSFNDVSTYFEDVLEDLPVLQHDLDAIIAEIGSDYDDNKLAVNQ